jgi:3-methylcrotonyl-CoA carboxylase alpha subunit
VGPSTNAAFLYRLMHNAAFAAGDLDTGLIEREGDVLVGAALTVAAEEWALAAAAWLAVEEAESIRERAGHPQAAGTALFSPIPDRWEDPWAAVDSWRVHGAGSRWLRLSLGEARAELRIEPAREGRGFTVYNGEEVICLADLRWDRATAALSGLVGSRTIACRAVVQPGGVHVFLPGRHLRFVVHAPGEDSSDEAGHAGGLTAPMPGKVLAMMVGLGAVVERGQPLAVLEAMKMEHLIVAPSAGRISAIMHPVGSQVQEGAALLAIEPVAP